MVGTFYYLYPVWGADLSFAAGFAIAYRFVYSLSMQFVKWEQGRIFLV